MPAGSQIASTPEQLVAEARRVTGIDIRDPDAIEPLGMLLRSFNGEANLHAEGAKAIEARMLRILCNRLRMQRDFANHPEIAEQRLTAPIFLCGMGRTGSTKAHKLFAASGDFNWLPYWKSVNPSLYTGSRDESPQARIDDCEKFARWFDAASPETKYAHAFETHEPEEESSLLEHSLRSPVWLGWGPIDGYLNWLLARDMTSQFAYLRDALKYLQWQGLASETKRWFLKCPLYAGLERPLHEIFPDACMLMTHRHPADTMPSSLQLLCLFYRPYTPSKVSAKPFLLGQAAAIEMHLKNRTTLANLTFLDIDYRELIGTPDAVIERVYRHCGLPLSPASRQRMLDWDRNNPPHSKGGKHSYSLAEFGITRGRIDTLFAGYIEFLQKTFGAR